MQRIQFLHQNAPSGVDIYTNDMRQTMEDWNELFNSKLFSRCQWQPDFLAALTTWLQEHLIELNRAEVISFYYIYQPSLPREDIRFQEEPWITLQEILLDLASKHLADFLTYAHSQTRYAPDSSQKSHGQRSLRSMIPFVCCSILLIIVVSVWQSHRFISSVTADSEYYLHDPTKQWQSDDLFTKAFPDGYPLTEAEERCSGLIDGDQLLITTYLKENLHPDADVKCLQDATNQQPAIYQVTPAGTPAVTYQLYIEKNEEVPGAYRLLASTYIPEMFLAFARQNQISGRVWVDSAYEAHIVLYGDNVNNRFALSAVLLKTYNQFRAYHDKGDSLFVMPAVNLTTVYGGEDSNWWSSEENIFLPDISTLPRTYTYFSAEGITLSFRPD